MEKNHKKGIVFKFQTHPPKCWDQEFETVSFISLKGEARDIFALNYISKSGLRYGCPVKEGELKSMLLLRRRLRMN